MTNIDVEKLMGEIEALRKEHYDNPWDGLGGTSEGKREAARINGYNQALNEVIEHIQEIRKHAEQPVSGGDEYDANYWKTRYLLLKAKQPTTADETLREALEWIRNETAPPVHGTMGDMPTINAVWEVANKALSQPSKPAMTREELRDILFTPLSAELDDNFEGEVRRAIDLAITALDEAGVLNVRHEP